MIRYPVEMAIVFEGGSGTTRSVGREGVAFVTDAPLAVGRRLAGTLRSGAGPDGTATTLRYRARVTAVRPAGEPGLLEVEARFEDPGFGVPATGDTPGPPLGARGGLLAGLAAFVPLLG